MTLIEQLGFRRKCHIVRAAFEVDPSYTVALMVYPADPSPLNSLPLLHSVSSRSESQDESGRSDRDVQTAKAVRDWCLHGDERAAQWLVFAYRPLIRSIVQSLACPGQADDAEQETLIRAFTALHRYDPDQPFARWIGTIARNVLLNSFRATTRYERCFSRDTEGTINHRAAGGMPDDRLMAKERLEAIIGWLDGCEPRSSRIFRRHVFDGLSPDEVSAAEGLSPGAIRISIHRTRSDLRSRLASLS